MKQLAIIGSTASGKTSLAINLASELNAYILSLDSLSIYKEIDIASAKPSKTELSKIKHFGIDLLRPNEKFDVINYVNLYQDIYNQCQQDRKNLIIVGGTSFYLKSLITGISPLPRISAKTKTKTKNALLDLQGSYNMLTKLDANHMSRINPMDKYRIEKMLDIYHQTQLSPTEYFRLHKPTPIIKNKLNIYQIYLPKKILRSNIVIRTKQMIDMGIIDEVSCLERLYTREPNCMKSIGIKESLDYLDGIYSKCNLIDKIITNTARLAKRQATFNSSQFEEKYQGSPQNIFKKIMDSF